MFEEEKQEGLKLVKEFYERNPESRGDDTVLGAFFIMECITHFMGIMMIGFTAYFIASYSLFALLSGYLTYRLARFLLRLMYAQKVLKDDLC